MARNSRNTANTDPAAANVVPARRKLPAHVEAILAKIPESGTVTVACKLPNGLALRVFRMISQQQPVMGGGMRDVQVAQQVGEEVRLYGYAVPHDKRPNYSIIGDYALTPNVDAEFFRTWVEQNWESDVLKNGLIFAHASSHMAQDHAAERGGTRSGFEPMNPDKDPRVGARPVRESVGSVGPIETEENLKKALSAGNAG